MYFGKCYKFLLHILSRLPDGTQIRKSFQITDTIKQVREFVDSNAVINGKYNLVLSIPPRKEFSNNDETLQQCGLSGNASILVIPAVTIVAEEEQKSNGLFNWIYAILASMVTVLTLGFFKRPNNTPNNSNDSLPSQEASNQSVSRSSKSDNPEIIAAANKSTLHSKNLVKKGNVAGFGDQKDEKSDKDKNVWNGDSTEYKQ